MIMIPAVVSAGDISPVVQQQDSTKTVRRSPRGAMFRSLVFPGWGQWYNGKKVKSAAVFGAEAGLLYGIFVQNDRFKSAVEPDLQEFYHDDRNKLIWWLGGAIIYSMLDAFVDAYLDDFDAEMDITKSGSSAFSVNIRYRFPVR